MSKILLFDTYERQKREFVPLEAGKVKMYTCGPTVYDYPHIGNLRAYVFADVLRRMLENNGFVVTQVMNITDVGHLTSDADEGEDKVESQAKKTGRSAQEIAAFFTEIFANDLAILGIQSPTVFCKATGHITEQITLVKRLEEKGYTYRTSDGLYFDTSKFPNYGKLARLDTKGMRPGARVELNREKRNPTDFALWKFSPAGSKRQMEWGSPWGVGFPGWHVECSAMAMQYLGETLDIHTGGIDHIPVHHTNEIAQSEAATGKPFVHYWLHCAFLQVEGQKMSKSLGNIFTLNDLAEKGYDPLAFRYLLLTSHYRSQMNFTWAALNGAAKALDTLRTHIAEWPISGKADESLVGEFRKHLNNDVDTPRALAHVWEKIIPSDRYSAATKKATLLEYDRILGLRLTTLPKSAVVAASEEIPASVRSLLTEREDLRKRSQWKEADNVRQKIADAGYVIEDTRNGIRLKKKAD